MEEHTAKSVYVQNDLKAMFFDMTCPKGGNVQAFLTDLRYKCEELAAMGVHITEKEYQCTLLQGLPDELVKFASQLLATVCIVHHTLTVNINTLISHICEEVEHLKNHHARSQRGQEWDKKGEGLIGEVFAATRSKGGRRRHRRGNCHTCREVGCYCLSKQSNCFRGTCSGLTI